MQSAVAFLALVASASAISAPVVSGGVPSECTSNFDGTFLISPQNQSTYTPNSQTLSTCTTNPIISLQDGTLKDQQNRQAEVVANDQFQFDEVLQDPRKYDTGFQVCTNPSNSKDVTLAHGGNTTFFRCNSGSFDNIYDDDIDGKCKPIYVVVLPCGANSKPNSSGSGSGSSGSSSSSSSSSTSSGSYVTSSTPSTSVTVATTPAVASPSSVPVVAPYPTGNATAPAASGTGSPSSTAPGSSTSSPLTAPASGAEALAIGSKFGAVAAALIAFAML